MVHLLSDITSQLYAKYSLMKNLSLCSYRVNNYRLACEEMKSELKFTSKIK